MEKAFYLDQFAALSNIEKKLVLYIFDLEILVKKGKFTHIRQKRDTIARRIGCCLKTISRFNNKVKYFLIAVIEKWKGNGNQGANEYRMDPEFFAALKLLYDNKLLYKSKSEILEFANSHRQNENVPLAPPKCPSSYVIPSYEREKEYGYVHPHVEKIGGLSLKERLALSQYPEFAIVAGIEDCVWYSKHRKINNLMALIQSRIRKRL